MQNEGDASKFEIRNPKSEIRNGDRMNETYDLVKRVPQPQELDRPPDAPPQPRSASYGYGADIGADHDVHLLDYWRAIRKRLWLVFGVTAIITTLAMIYMARKPDIYEADARVQIDQENNPAYATGGNSPYIYSPVNDPAYFNTQLQILTSPGLLRRVAKTLDLEHSQAFLRPQSARKRSSRSKRTPPGTTRPRPKRFPLSSRSRLRNSPRRRPKYEAPGK